VGGRENKHMKLGLRILRLTFGVLLGASAPIASYLFVSMSPWLFRAAGGGAFSSNEILLCAALITAIASLGGFVSTTILMWKREHAEITRRELESERIRLEIEKIRHELGRAREPSSSASPSTPDG